MIKVFILGDIRIKDALPVQAIFNKDDFIYSSMQNIDVRKFKKILTIVDSVGDADYLLLRNNYFSISKNKKLIKEIEDISFKNNKKIIVFAYGDRNDDVDVRNSIVLRTSKLKSDLKSNEIIIPAFVEDVGLLNGYENKLYQKGLPVIGFSGWVACSNIFQWFKYILKIITEGFKIYVLRNSSFYNLKGLFFRRRVLSVLQKSNLIKTNLYLRKYFSGHKNTIEDDPETIRKQFISSIKDSDLALAIKGDGNYSLRFFEILSLGRIPLLIDTDSPLPLEDEIDYDEFILRVDYKDIKNLPQIISNFWSKMTPERFIEMQNNARKAFEYRLSAPAFYRYLFDNFDDIVKAHEGDIR